MFEDRVLKRIFLPESEEVSRCWRLLCNEVHHRTVQVWILRWAGALSRIIVKKMLTVFSFRKSEQLRPLGRSRRRWKYIIKMDLKEIGSEGTNQIHLAWDKDHLQAVVITMMNIRVPKLRGIS
jgi:hypothetical protein